MGLELPEGSPDGTLPIAPLVESKSTLILRGIAWNSIYHGFSIAAGFLSMFVLARVLSPDQYGHVTAVSGWLALFNAVGCQGFLAHALQLSDHDEPDWGLHWSACLWMQLPLFLAANGVAGLMWRMPSYRTLAPLLHLDSFALLLSVPHLLAAKMLERRFDFRRLQMFSVIIVILSTGVTLSLAQRFGAYAVIFGGSLCNLLPFTLYLFWGLRWRPQPGWWLWPDWKRYGPALAFGAQYNLGTLLHGAKSIAEAAILPNSIGFGAMGLINRSQGLFQGTLGRLSSLVMDSAYPVLPRLAANSHEYPRQATAFFQTALLGLIPAGVFVAVEGPKLSRLLYGAKWVAADPLLLPGTIAGMFAIILILSKNILLAANNLRASYVVNIVAAICAVIPVVATKFQAEAVTYLWLMVAFQCSAAVVSVIAARRFLTRAAVYGFLAPACSAGLGIVGILLFRNRLARLPLLAELVVEGFLYALIIIATLRIGFPDSLASILRYLPGGSAIRRGLRLH